MKNFHKIFLHKTNWVGLILLLASSTINATTISFTDTFNPDPDPLISFGSSKSYSFTHSIVTDQDGVDVNWEGTYGYNPLTDAISSASITLLFKDESTDIVSESVQLIFDNQSFGTQTITSGGATYTATILSGLDALLSEGILNVTLENAGLTSGHLALRSDFLFLESTLTVAVKRQESSLHTQAITEPPTLLLFCSILSLFTFNRRISSKSIRSA